MKSSQLDKLYSKLTPTELGTLAIDALARLDENEADLIVNSVEWRTYRSVHADYRRRVENDWFYWLCATAWNIGEPVP
jgi:hypothetical protein